MYINIIYIVHCRGSCYTAKRLNFSLVTWIVLNQAHLDFAEVSFKDWRCGHDAYLNECILYDAYIMTIPAIALWTTTGQRVMRMFSPHLETEQHKPSTANFRWSSACAWQNTSALLCKPSNVSLGLNQNAICAGLVHNVVDTAVTLRQWAQTWSSSWLAARRMLGYSLAVPCTCGISQVLVVCWDCSKLHCGTKGGNYFAGCTVYC